MLGLRDRCSDLVNVSLKGGHHPVDALELPGDPLLPGPLLPPRLLHPPLEAVHHGLDVLHQARLVSGQFLLKIRPYFLKPLESPCFILRHAFYLMKTDDGKIFAFHDAKKSDFIN